MMIVILLALVAITQQVGNYYPLKANYWGSYQYKVQYANNSLIYGNTAYMPFTVPFASPVANLLDISAVLATYELGSKNGMHFKITQPVSSGASASFTLKVFSPSVFNYLRLFIVYNTQLAKDFFEINVYQTTSLPNLDTSAATLRTQTLSSTTRLHFVGPTDTYNVIPMLSHIMLDNPNEIIHFELNATKVAIANYVLTAELQTKSRISAVMVTFFIIKTNLQPEEYVFDINKNYLITPNTVAANAINTRCTANFNIPAVRYGTSFNQNCSFGIQKLTDDNITVMRRIDFDVGVTGSGFTGCVNTAATNASGGNMDIQYAILCSYKAVCLNSNEYYDSTTAASNLCNLCSTLNTSCTTCNKTHCYTCITGFYPQNSGGSTTCLTCSQVNCTICLTAITCAKCTTYSYLSNQTCLTCTNIANCLQCSSNTFCLDCVIGYGPDPNGTCRACSLMMTQCAACSNFYTCSQCNTGYYVAVGGSSCSSCSTNITNCDTCAASFNCTGCKVGYFLYDYGSCVSCSGNISSCMRCSNLSVCSQCSYGYYLVSATSCAGCSTPLPGCLNCTDVPICVQCQLGYYLLAGICYPCTDSNCQKCSSPINCDICKPDFQIATNNMNCLCIVGWPITGVCTKVVGCTTAVKISNVSTCIFCNNFDKFILSNSTCVCQTGYKLQGTQCVISCGDGIILGSEECDDNNDVSGDGCSSVCLQELGYKCGYNGTVYKCVYTANFTIKLKYILRHDTENAGTYYFEVSPTTVNFNKMDLNSNLKLAISGRTSPTDFKTNSITYKEGIFVVDVDFEKDLQNLPATLSMDFDASYFNTTRVVYSFTSIGTNNPLIVSSLGSAFENFKIASYIIVGLAGLILVVSVAYDKMIGIETVNTIQMIVFSKLLYVQNDLLLSNHISSMKYISGYNEIGQDWSQVNQVPVIYRRLQYSSDYILNFQTGLLLMVVSLVVVVIFYIYKAKTMRTLMRTKKGSIDEFKLGEQRLNEKLRFIYERVIFVVACVTLFDCVASVRIQSRCLIGESHYSYFLINLSTMIFSIVYIFAVLSYEIISIGKKHEWQSHFCSYADSYTGYYVFYLLLTTPVLVAGEQILGVAALSLLAGIVLANAVVMAVWTPYNHIVHNAAVIFNNVVVLMVLGISATMGYIAFDESIQLIFTYALMGLLFVVEMLAVVRLYLAKLSAPKESTKLNRLNDAEKELNKTMENAESDFLKSNTKRSKNRARRAQEEQDQLTLLKNRLKKQFNNQNEAILEEED